MIRFAWSLCALSAAGLVACSSSDSPGKVQAPVDSGTPSQDALPDTAETPEAAQPESGTPDAEPEAEAEGGPDSAADDGQAEAEAGTKQAGQFCKEAWECADGMNCVSGQYTPAHCNPNCTNDDDCAGSAPGAKGSCQAAGGSIKFCLYYCGMMGGTCPGDLKCDGAVCS